MSWLDVVLGTSLLLAAYVGYRGGLAARALSWGGFALGLVFGVLFVDDIANLAQSAQPRIRLLVTIVAVLLCALAGQLLGWAVGSLLARRVTPGGPLRTIDKLAGAAVGVLAILLMVWLLIPALASTPGWPARAVRDSEIARAIEDIAPDPPNSLAVLGRFLGDAPFPQVFERLTSPLGGDPPAVGLAPDVTARVAPAVVRVQGRACSQVQSGSGFVVAPGLVVTNAHVVAGQDNTLAFFPDGRRVDAVVVGFDGDRDLALLRVDSGGVGPLARADAPVDSTGAVFGYPRAGPLEQAPARITQRITAAGSDITYLHPTRRDIYVLAARLAPGYSGGPLVDPEGRVTGVAFAIDRADEDIAYALSGAELDAFLGAVLASGATATVDTGACLVG